MPTRRRQPLLAALAAALPVLLVLGVYLGGHPEDLPGFARSAFVADHETRVVDEAINRIASDYYRPIAKGRLTNASIAGAVSSLGDRFSHYLSPREYRQSNQPPSFTGIGVSVGPDRRGLRIARVFDGSPAAHAGLRAGDLIVMANGHKLAGLPAEKAIALIKGPPGTDVRLGVEQRRGGHTAIHTLTLTRATISEPVVASATKDLHGVKLGVVALATFSAGAHGEVREGVERELRAGARGIVLDLRANGGGLVEEARLIASIFVAKGTIVSTRGRTQPSETLSATGAAISPRIPVVVLVDGNTASAAEIVTAALQDHRRATVVGTHTFGKGVFQEEEPLSNGGALDITVGQYFTPNGRNLGGGGVKQGAGIAPEVLVRHGVDTNHGLDAALATLSAKVK
ncbi:MAG TPA: S41 family peptidase [Solirubrobacteraceae bacterium]|jgi:carboxyl-terminal processing protease|nr:S41 family peptidase [Solirubrobacteraceae bacterium]